jgi:hypothetical protein
MGEHLLYDRPCLFLKSAIFALTLSLPLLSKIRNVSNDIKMHPRYYNTYIRGNGSNFIYFGYRLKTIIIYKTGSADCEMISDTLTDLSINSPRGFGIMKIPYFIER